MTPQSQTGKAMLFRLLRFGFRLVPISEAARDRLRQRFLDRYSHLVPTGPRGQIAPPTVRRARVRSDEPAIGHVAYRKEPLPSPLPATLVAFYLPQFHPIAENDQWWGKGFTEWRNVARALPQFEGHAQPRLPADLGFYDLRNVDTMREQARLASEYGIGAFCFYFYWFSGRTLLEQPLRQWLDDPTLQLPFCLCWANENWSRRWDGRSDDILIAQQHSAEDDIAFIAYIAAYLSDPRYLRVEGKPLLLVYRPDLLPDAKQTAQRWRQWCRANEIGEIHIAYVQGFERPDPRDIGFDAAVEFPPNLSNPSNLTADQRLLNPEFEGQVLDWRELAADYSARAMPAYPLYPGVNAGWDNEPRRPGKGRVYLHASPRRYRDWLQSTITTRLAGKPPSERLVFVNAWNEWAEGAVLEPDSRLGHAWLQATRSALQCAAALPAPALSAPRICAVVHGWYTDTFAEILAALKATGLPVRLIVTTAPAKVDQIRAMLERHEMQAEIEVRDNRGRDIVPFLHVANRLIDEGEETVLKLNTGHLPHRRESDHWRREILGSPASQDRAGLILQAFAIDRTLGMVVRDGGLQQFNDCSASHENDIRRLATRVGVTQTQIDSERWASGSACWLRIDALRPLLDAHFDTWELGLESATMGDASAHAMDVLLALCVQDAGLRIDNFTAVCAGTDRATAPHHPGVRRH